MKEQITQAEENIQHLNLEMDKINEELRSSTTPKKYTEIEEWLSIITTHEDDIHKQRIQKKLNHLYKGTVHLPNFNDNFLNLSDYTLTKYQIDFLNLGPNCHLFNKYKHINKKSAIELLYQDIVELKQKKIIKTHPEINDLLKAESIINRQNSHKNNTLLNHNLKEAANQLRTHPDIIIKKADKTNIYVILNKSEYNSKLQAILNDDTKFKKVK